jgi:hypothetical protein
MARISGPTTPTTQAEQNILEFLFANKGEEYTAEELQQHTGIRADLIPGIMDNLRWKGFEVATEKHRGVHYFVKNSIWSYLIVASLMAFMLIMLIGAWLH